MLAQLSAQNPDEAKRVERELYSSLAKPIRSVGLISLVISLSWLVQPLYMMNLFDRVLSSNSGNTLVALTIITLYLIVIASILEAIRQKVLVRVGLQVDQLLGERMFRALMKAGLGNRLSAANLGQLDAVRGFVGSQSLVTFFDLPFVPIYLVVLWLMHPMLGVAAMLGVGAMAFLTLTLQGTRRKRLVEGAAQSRNANRFADVCLRNAETVEAMGMEPDLRRRWRAMHEQGVSEVTEISDFMAYLQSAMKGGLLVFSIVMMALATWLVIDGSLTAGALFATNVLAMRVLQPVQMALGGWESYVKAREALKNIVLLLVSAPKEDENRHALPAPQGRLSANGFAAGPPGDKLIIVKNVKFELPKGQAMALIGPSGSGKSSLAKCMVGLWPGVAGFMRLDGADFSQWADAERGPYIGYVPQDIEFFEDTIARNIARFGEPDSVKVIAAAKEAGIHELILSLESGYDTVIKPRRGVLSMGQRQRLAIARAIYGNPSLLVMDEPNSNLDAAGMRALKQLIMEKKRSGTTVVVVAHDRTLLSSIDFVIAMNKGKQIKFGPRSEVLQRFGVELGFEDGATKSAGPASQSLVLDGTATATELDEEPESSEKSVPARGAAG